MITNVIGFNTDTDSSTTNDTGLMTICLQEHHLFKSPYKYSIQSTDIQFRMKILSQVETFNSKIKKESFN